jgi:hypothetical protein
MSNQNDVTNKRLVCMTSNILLRMFQVPVTGSEKFEKNEVSVSPPHNSLIMLPMTLHIPLDKQFLQDLRRNE